MRKIALILLFILVMSTWISALAEVSMFACSVGKGDALILRVGDWVGLVDAGKPGQMGRVRAALRSLNITALDAVFLTHTDNDHAGGMEWLSESEIPVGAWYASGMYTGVKAKKHPMVKAAAERDMAVNWLQRGDVIPLGDTGAQLRVLAPIQLFEDKDDNNSLVMMLETPEGNILLTGDMELPEEGLLLGQGDDLSCAILKVPNHGDDDTTSQALAQACRAQAAIISTDGQEKPGTPDPDVVARLNAVGTQCYVTEEAGFGIMAKLSGGQASVEMINVNAPLSNVAIRAVDAEEDTITLYNPEVDQDMTDWTLYSDRGDELYTFPAGTVLSAGSTLTVGTLSTKGSCDLLWDDKNVIHDTKADDIYLYDQWGRLVDVDFSG